MSALGAWAIAFGSVVSYAIVGIVVAGIVYRHPKKFLGYRITKSQFAFDATATVLIWPALLLGYIAFYVGWMVLFVPIRAAQGLFWWVAAGRSPWKAWQNKVARS